MDSDEAQESELRSSLSLTANSEKSIPNEDTDSKTGRYTYSFFP